MHLLGKLTLLSILALSLAAAPAAAQVSASSEGKPASEHGYYEGENQAPPHQHGHHRPFHGGHIIKDTAALLGIKPQTLVEQLKQGKTLLEIVQASKGWTEEQYILKLTELTDRHLLRAQAEGKLSAKEASRIKEQLANKLERIINRSWNPTAPGHPALDYKHNQINWTDSQQQE